MLFMTLYTFLIISLHKILNFMRSSQKRDQKHYARTDRRTGGRTDTPSYRDARTHLKNSIEWFWNKTFLTDSNGQLNDFYFLDSSCFGGYYWAKSRVVSFLPISLKFQVYLLGQLAASTHNSTTNRSFPTTNIFNSLLPPLLHRSCAHQSGSLHHHFFPVGDTPFLVFKVIVLNSFFFTGPH